MSKAGKAPKPGGNPPGSGKAGKGPGNSKAKNIFEKPWPKGPAKGSPFKPGPGSKGGKPPKT